MAAKPPNSRAFSQYNTSRISPGNKKALQQCKLYNNLLMNWDVTDQILSDADFLCRV